MKSNSHVKSVARCLQLLDLMGEKGQPLSLTELSLMLDWPKSTVHGILSTLRDYDYVDQTYEDGKYTLGIKLFELGNRLQSSWDIHSIARPVMVKLNAGFGETVHLAIEDKGEVLYLEKIDSNHLIRIVSQVGTRLPMYCTGVGKVLLAYQPEQIRKKNIAKQSMQAYTSKTITGKEKLLKELSLIRERGYAYDNGEIMDSLQCVAAPIHDRNSNVVYALSVSGLSHNMTRERMESITKELLMACKKISKAIGYKE